MKAKIADEIVVDAHGRTASRGQILEVIDRGGILHCRVRWDDGHESVFFPDSTTHVVKISRATTPG